MIKNSLFLAYVMKVTILHFNIVPAFLVVMSWWGLAGFPAYS